MNPTDVLQSLIERTKRLGADAADAILIRSASVSVARRLGKPESLERSESTDLGLRVFAGQRQAIVSTNDLSPGTLGRLAEQALAMARAVPEDPWCGLAEPSQLTQNWPELDLCDPEEPAIETLIERADRTEDAARAVAGVTNSEGASAAFGTTDITLAASNGFVGSYSSTDCSLSVSVVAGQGENMERDYDYDAQTYFGDLKKPEDIGIMAGRRAVERLNPRPVRTGKFPVVYDPRVSGGIVSVLAGAANGASVARGATLLKDKMGAQLLPAHINIVDDPHIRRGHRSRPFDAEGLAAKRTTFIENGCLKTWFLDLATARQLSLPPTGHAVRGASAPPSAKPSNLYMLPGSKTPEQLIAEIEDGFYITEMLGSSISILTGDYSRGAAGFWIKGGKLAYPVSGVTVASNLLDMWKNIEPANDLTLRYGIDAPTLRIDGMTVAGS